MITTIDLSGFGECSKSSLKELIEAVELLPCLRAISLRNNGLNDDYDNEILTLMSLKGVTKLDFSKNLIGKKFATVIGNKLKNECQHISWIDLTQNCFDSDSQAMTNIITGLTKQRELNYIGLSPQEL